MLLFVEHALATIGLLVVGGAVLLGATIFVSFLAATEDLDE